jgi:hypothetical protein
LPATPPAVQATTTPSATATSTPPVVATIITRRASPKPGTLLVEKGTMVRLMIVNEVSTRTAKDGDRFPLRVDEDVMIDGTKIIPVGATAWGEIADIKESGSAGVAGKIAANLLYVETPFGRAPLTGERDKKGSTGGAGLGLAIYSFGVFGLLMKGNEGRLRAGDIFNGYFAKDMIYDPATRSLLALTTEVPPAAGPVSPPASPIAAVAPASTAAATQ